MQFRLAFAALMLLGCTDGASGGFADFSGESGNDAAAPPSDMHASSSDMHVTRNPDLARPPADLADNLPARGNIGTTGGSVDRIYFAFHGDTRPANCNDVSGYPTSIIDNIYQRELAHGVQFAVDAGDHMFACQSGASTSAAPQMQAYMTASDLLGRPTFMTMGNHECASSQTYCTSSSTSPNYKAFMSALAPISSKPYYKIDITTATGLATFVMIADNAWTSTEQSWLESTLTTADTNARYTIIARHHPIGNTELSTLDTEWQIISSHKYALFITGHTHEYKHDTFLDGTGRTVRIGNAGAPLDNNFPWYGFGTVEQTTIGDLEVRIYDQATDNLMDSFSLGPNM